MKIKASLRSFTFILTVIFLAVVPSPIEGFCVNREEEEIRTTRPPETQLEEYQILYKLAEGTTEKNMPGNGPMPSFGVSVENAKVTGVDTLELPPGIPYNTDPQNPQ